MLAEMNTGESQRRVRRDPAHSYPMNRGPVLPDNWYVRWKGRLDRVGAMFLLVLTAPVIVLAMILVKLTSRGPALYSQIRVGRHGRPFWIYKLRTMYHNCEDQSGPRWATALDARITPLGWILRRTHLDELPQLWNVLRGDMSLIGPRPERPEFVDQLEVRIPRYLDRLLVLPGVTGLAQVQLPPDTDLTSVRRKLARDLCYVQKLSFGLDLRIVLLTACDLISLPFKFSRRLFPVPAGDAVEKEYELMVAADEHVEHVQSA
jgi:lipopolysaccharide/colanic/teichoic acid biosynthesis glycosyltransferase